MGSVNLEQGRSRKAEYRGADYGLSHVGDDLNGAIIPELKHVKVFGIRYF